MFWFLFCVGNGILMAKERGRQPVDTNSNPQYVCTCGRRYNLKGSLSRHMKYECGKQPSFRCPVPGCDQAFHHNFKLIQHLPSHDEGHLYL